jgi:ankyrin repeat protein
MSKPTPSIEDIDLLYMSALEGNVENLSFLLDMYHFSFRNIVKAYMYATKRMFKLRPNEELRNIIITDINKLRAKRIENLEKLNTAHSANDKTLLEQGLQVEIGVAKIYTYIEPLLNMGNHNSMFALYLCKINNYTLFEQFISSYNNINYNYKKKNGKTMLHIACINENVTFVQHLLQQRLSFPAESKENQFLALKTTKINPNICDKHFKTPLHYAVELANISIVKLLLDYNSDVDALDINNFTPLYYVAPGTNGNVEIFNLLLEYGADINTKWQGKTILYNTVKDNQPEAVAYLLEHGADPTIKCVADKKGYIFNLYYETPLLLAQDLHYDTVEQQLDNFKIIDLLYQ